MSHLFLKKDIPQLIADAEDPEVEGGYSEGGLKRTLGPFSITMLGVGAIVGAGVFTLTGKAAANNAGPGIVYCFMISGALCVLAGLCYAEMAAMIPVSGSAYAYAYATMGEGIAWIMGLSLVLDYAFGAGAVANGWSSYLLSLLRTTGITLPDAVLYYTKCPWELVTLSSGHQVYGLWNVPASLIAIIATIVLYRGITGSAKLNTIVVITNIAIIVLFITLGIGLVSWARLHANLTTTGLASLVPAREVIFDAAGHQVARYGWLRGGVMTGAGVLFFAFIGFDSVSTVAQEAKNPKRDIPIGIMTSLLICTILYILVGFTLTGVVYYKNLDVSDPIALGIDQIVALRSWNPVSRVILTFIVKLGALAGLSSVVLVVMLGYTRVLYAMAKDRLLPWFGSLHAHNKTPYVATIFAGALVAVCSGFLPINLIVGVTFIGQLVVFLLVCVGVIIMRCSNPELERPFRIPLIWLVGTVGVVFCLWIMSSFTAEAWIYLVIFIFFVLGIYCLYGRRHSRQQKTWGFEFGSIWIDSIGLVLQLFGLIGLVFVRLIRLTPSRSSSMLFIYSINNNILIVISLMCIIIGLGMTLMNVRKTKFVS